MSEKEDISSDEGDVPLKQALNNSSTEKKSASKKGKKSTKKDSAPAATTSESTSAKEDEKTKKNRPRKKYYVEVDEENDDKAVPLLDQPAVVEGSRQRRTVVQLNVKHEVLKIGSIPIPPGKGVPLGRIPTVSSRFKRLRIDEIKHLHRLMFGKLGNLSNLNNNILKFNGFPFPKDSPEYAKKLVALGKMNASILREFLFFFDLDLKIKKKEDVAKAILEFMLSPKRAEISVNPNIVSHPKRKATKRNYYEREVEDDQKRQRKSKSSKAKEGETAKQDGDASSADESATKGKQKENNSSVDEESKENNSGADNTNELKKPAKKRKRNQVIEEQPESTDDGKSKRSKSKETTDESAKDDGSDLEVNTTENLSDDELKTFLKKVLADANLEKTTMKTVYSLISKHYPNYNFSKKKDFIKEVVKSAIQT